MVTGLPLYDSCSIRNPETAMLTCLNSIANKKHVSKTDFMIPTATWFYK